MFVCRQVLAEGSKAASNVGTMGVALSVCTLPGQAPSTRLDADTIEIGLGASTGCIARLPLTCSFVKRECLAVMQPFGKLLSYLCQCSSILCSNCSSDLTRQCMCHAVLQWQTAIADSGTRRRTTRKQCVADAVAAACQQKLKLPARAQAVFSTSLKACWCTT